MGKRTFLLVIPALVLGALYLWAASLPGCGASNTVACIVTRSAWPQAYGGPYDVYYQAVPTTLTVVDAATSHLLGYCVSNTTGSAVTFTIETGDASPLTLPLTGSISANTQVCANLPWGLLTNGGFAVQAGSTGMLWQATWTH
jgi:hypothetical protein